jgi:Na+-transporting NADH:ubiquinone oxidoreductase subunit A
MAKNPRLVKTHMGACVSELAKDEFSGEEVKVISGSVLNGRIAENEVDFLGRFHRQISLLKEEREKHFLGWAIPTPKQFSVKNIMLSALTPNKKFNLTMALNGGRRAIVPIGSYESVMPLDILPTFLLRMLAVGDIEEAEKLGALELDEEDLALCTFVCQSKIEHGVNLRNLLTNIEKEG